jgi:hypothetical protein
MATTERVTVTLDLVDSSGSLASHNAATRNDSHPSA